MHISRVESQKTLPSIYASRGEVAVNNGPLQGNISASVVIIGGGLSGVSAALHAATLGQRVVLVEAGTIGNGASGRSFGQVVPYLRRDTQHAIDKFGDDAGGRLVRAAMQAPDLVYDLIQQHSIDCDAMRSGLIIAAYNSADLNLLEKRVAYWVERQAPVRLLSRHATAEAVGGGTYPGALLDERGGTVNSLALTRGLARAARQAGAIIYENTEVSSLTKTSSLWRVRTPQGTIEASTVLVCTNAYKTELSIPIDRCVQPLRVHQLVTEPISSKLLERVLPGGQALTDTRPIPSGVRVLPDRRILITGDGPSFKADGKPATARATARIAELFPFLGPVRWADTWSGWIDVAIDQFPKIFESEAGLYAGLGYSGRGLGLAVLMGRELVNRASGLSNEETLFPVVAPEGQEWNISARLALRIEILRRRFLYRSPRA